MAKIILNVVLNDEAYVGIEKLKQSIAGIQIPKSSIVDLNSLQKQYANLLSSLKAVKANYPEKTFETLTDSVKENLTVIKALNAAYKDSGKLTGEQKDLFEKLKKELSDISATFSTTKAENDKLTGSTEKSKQSIGELAGKFLQWQTAATLVMKPLDLLRSALDSVNETLEKTENAVVSLQRVLPSGAASDSEISDKLYQLAQDYGQTFENVSEIANNFARTGMSWADTVRATEAALLGLNVAELDATESSEGMIAIMSQFHLEAENLVEVIDKLNKVSDSASVTTEKLLTALQRTGSSADNANLSLDETIGIVTALSKATGRSGENLGTAVNSLIQYSTKAESLRVFAELSEDTAKVVEQYEMGAANILDVWQAVSGVIQDMDARQEELLEGLIHSDDIQNLEQELQDELGDIFEQVGDVYGTANTFRKNYFIALLGNMDEVDKAIATASEASGYSAEENQKYMETYAAKVTTLQAKWQELANDEQGLLAVKKGLADMGIGILNAVDAVGGLKTAFGIVGTVALAVFSKKIASSIDTAAKNVKDFATNVKALFTTMKKGEATVVSFGTKLSKTLSVISLIATAINIGISLWEKYGDTLENAEKKLQSLKDEIETNEAEIVSINSELETTREKIAEMESLDKLSFTDQEEYDRLVDQSEELENQLRILKLINEEKNREARDNFVKAMAKDLTEDGKEHYYTTDYADGGTIQSAWEEAEIFVNNLLSLDFNALFAGEIRNYLTEQGAISFKFDDYKKRLKEIETLDKEYEDDQSNKDYIEKRKSLTDENESIERYLANKLKELLERSSNIYYVENPENDVDLASNRWLDYIKDFEDRFRVIFGGEAIDIKHAFERAIKESKYADDTYMAEWIESGKRGAFSDDKITEDSLYFRSYLTSLGLLENKNDFSRLVELFNSLSETEKEEKEDEKSEGAEKTEEDQTATTTTEYKDKDEILKAQEDALKALDELLNGPEDLKSKAKRELQEAYKELEAARDSYEKAGEAMANAKTDEEREAAETLRKESLEAIKAARVSVQEAIAAAEASVAADEDAAAADAEKAEEAAGRKAAIDAVSSEIEAIFAEIDEMLDPTDKKSDREKAVLEYNAAQEALKNAQAAYEDAEKAMENAETEEEIAAAQAALDKAKSDVDAAKTTAEAAKTAIELAIKAEAEAAAAAEALQDIVDTVSETVSLQERAAEVLEYQNSLLEKQKELEETIAKARRQSVLDAIADGLEQMQLEEDIQDRVTGITERQNELNEAAAAQAEEQAEATKRELESEIALQKLRQAELDRTERVYNAKTGAWEWQANRDTVKELTEQVEAKATDAETDTESKIRELEETLSEEVAEFYDWLDDQKVKEVQAAFEQGLLDNNGVLNEEALAAILEKWDSKKTFGEDSSNINDFLRSWIETGLSSFDPDSNSDVIAARESLAGIEESLAKFIGNNAVSDLKEAIEDGNLTDEEVAAVMGTLSKDGALLSQETIDGVTAPIVAAIAAYREKNGTPTGEGGASTSVGEGEGGDSEGLPVYDQGGVLHGLGGIKATEEDEMVLGPELTRRILDPTKNDQFDTFVKDMILLTGACRPVPPVAGNIVYRSDGNHTDSHDSHYSVNGVPISTADAEQYTIAELFRAMPLVK